MDDPNYYKNIKQGMDKIKADREAAWGFNQFGNEPAKPATPSSAKADGLKRLFIVTAHDFTGSGFLHATHKYDEAIDVMMQNYHDVHRQGAQITPQQASSGNHDVAWVTSEHWHDPNDSRSPFTIASDFFQQDKKTKDSRMIHHIEPQPYAANHPSYNIKPIVKAYGPLGGVKW